MNFLAHSVLTPDIDDWTIGNLAADLISKRESVLLPTRMQYGVRLHYRIDQYTDEHPLIREANTILHPTQGKYATVGTDLIWDLCLSANWDTYMHAPMATFIEQIYRHLLKHTDAYDTKLEERIRFMTDRDFLTKYTTVDGMQLITERIDKRTKFKSNLSTLMNDYTANQDQFQELFDAYFPMLVDQIAGWKREIEDE